MLGIQAGFKKFKVGFQDFFPPDFKSSLPLVFPCVTSLVKADDLVLNPVHCFK